MEDIIAVHSSMAVTRDLADALILLNGQGRLAGRLCLRDCLVSRRRTSGARLRVGQGGSATVALLLLVLGLFQLTVLWRDTLESNKKRQNRGVRPGKMTHWTALIVRGASVNIALTLKSPVFIIDDLLLFDSG